MSAGRTLAALAAALLALGAVPAAAQERLVVKPPDGWVQVAKDAEAGLRTVGFVPKGQTAATWTEMVLFQVALGRADLDPKTVAARLRDRWKAICRETKADEPKLFWDKDYLAAQIFMQCLDPKPGQGLRKIEALAVKAIQGRESFYLIERAWRADANGRGNPFASPEMRKVWLDFLASAELCDARLPKQPCKADEGRPKQAKPEKKRK